ncbi:hypothetical protein [Paenibacillus alvei]|uniref:hypothetical protein n=1 Tax=Paenibacillus alvei TaxID=44250 RepID=UPI0013776652|nr:hypothetical protein [Paenibacillus alvei]
MDQNTIKVTFDTTKTTVNSKKTVSDKRTVTDQKTITSKQTVTVEIGHRQKLTTDS